MTLPTASQTPNRSHAWRGSPIITKRQAATPRGATIQTSGTVNGRGRSGSATRRTSTPPQTSANANSVPILVRSYVSAASPTSEATATSTPVTSVVVCGTRVRESTRAAHAGSSPSRAIAKKMRGCPYWNTSSTADMDTTAPSATSHPTPE